MMIQQQTMIDKHCHLLNYAVKMPKCHLHERKGYCVWCKNRKNCIFWYIAGNSACKLVSNNPVFFLLVLHTQHLYLSLFTLSFHPPPCYTSQQMNWLTTWSMVENKGECTGSWLAAAAAQSLLSFNEFWTQRLTTREINWCKPLWRIYDSVAGLRRRTGCGWEEGEGCV